MFYQSSSRYIDKVVAMKTYIKLLQAFGRGNDTIMICSPNDPKEKIQKQIMYELDGIPMCETIEEERYIHPVKTVDEWLSEWQ